MALNIKDAETDRLVRRYAQLRRTSFTGAIKLAVEDALRRENALPGENNREQLEAFRAVVREAQQAYAALPTLDDRDHGDILYDEDGLPR